jgi:hypothetical protein
MRWRRTLARMSLIVVAAVGTVAAIASPATAQPTGCRTGYTWANNAWAQCSGGTGQYRVVADCIPFGGTQYGPWKTANGISWVYCPVWGQNTVNIRLQIFG